MDAVDIEFSSRLRPFGCSILPDRLPFSSQPLVSVIVPNYNHAKYLDERISSILNQTYGNIELIILDDCSSDDSREVIERYRSRAAIIQYNSENSGSSFKQWKKGIELSSGDFIWIAESDDSARPDFLEKVLPPLLIDEKCVLSFARTAIIDKDGNHVGGHKNQTILPRESYEWKGKKFIRNYLAKKNLVVNASSAVFRKDAALAIDGQYEKYRGCGDWLFWIEICELGNVFFCTEKLNFFRQHGNNTTDFLIKNNLRPGERERVLHYLHSHFYFTPLFKDWVRRHITRKCIQTYQ